LITKIYLDITQGAHSRSPTQVNTRKIQKGVKIKFGWEEYCKQRNSTAEIAFKTIVVGRSILGSKKARPGGLWYRGLGRQAGLAEVTKTTWPVQRPCSRPDQRLELMREAGESEAFRKLSG
jgi:hypothetical protein